MELSCLEIRQARVEDARSISLLCQQLGYSMSKEKIQIYLKSLEVAKERIVYVACKPENSILGWINIYVAHGILADRQAEIGGLIVDENLRGNGIGRLLIQKAQIWAQQQGCEVLQVRSRQSRGASRSQTMRQQAHAFYQNIGYEPCKTQLVLRKQLKGKN